MATTRTSVFAAIEGLVAFMLCLYAFTVVKALFAGQHFAAGAALALVSEHLSGAGQSLAAAAVLTLIYASRMRPTLSYGAAVVDTAKALGSSLVPRLSPMSVALIVANLVQAAVVVLVTPGYRAVWQGQLGQCGDATKLAWAPLFEELAFRVVVFSVVLQRTGGDLRLTLLTTAGLFAGLHLPNAIAVLTGGNNVPKAYVWLQVVAAAAVGGYLACAYAISGSLVEVVLIHAANNLAAVVWIGRDVVLGVQGAAGCSPVVTPELLVALAGQVALYVVALSVAWGQLAAITGADLPPLERVADGQGAGAGADSSGATAAAAALLTGCSFRSRHPIVYGHTAGGTAADAAGHVKND